MFGMLDKILPGLAEMPNVHPMVVHLPIAMLSGFVLMEVLGLVFKKDELAAAAGWMLYLGTLGAGAAVAAGLRAEGTLAHNEAIHEILLSHKYLGIAVLLISVVLSIWRLLRGARFQGTERLARLGFGVVMVSIMAFGADMGGLMVYKHGAGVKAVPVAEGHDHAGASGHNGGDRSMSEEAAPEPRPENAPASPAHADDGHERGPHDH